MGGHAFDRQKLSTPRMPQEIYDRVLQQTIEKLQSCYGHVASPLESPEKTSYGDVDVTVTAPLDPKYDPLSSPELATSLAKVLNAHAFITQKNSPTQNYAIPWPDQDDEEEARFIQLDVHYLATYEQFQWHGFHAAHGDLWNMLGSTIRQFGLTVNDTGMYLRIPEIEPQDKNKAKVFLTSNPADVLDFLGLDKEAWWTRFESKEAMFRYAASNRFFWVKPVKAEEETDGNIVGTVSRPPSGPGVIEGQEGGSDGKKMLKHNDRRRMQQRPVFAQWIEDFIPRCRDAGQYTSPRVTREQTKTEAFDKFGVQEEYEERLRKWKLERHRDELWRVTIKGSLPEEGVDPQFRSAATRTFKSILLEGARIDEVQVPEGVRCNRGGFYDLDAVKQWVSESWEDVGKVGWKIQLHKARVKQLEKEASRQLESDRGS